jgi:hypothetical protein
MLLFAVFFSSGTAHVYNFSITNSRVVHNASLAEFSFTNSIAHHCRSPDPGGAICIASPGSDFFIFFSTFLNCSSGRAGGAIFAHMRSAEIVAACFSDSVSTSGDAVSAVSSSSGTLFLLESTVATSHGHSDSLLFNGVFPTVRSLNSSDNSPELHASGVRLRSVRSPSISLSSFTNGSADVTLDVGGSAGEIARCNFVANGNARGSIVVAAGVFRLTACVFIDNTGDALESLNGSLFARGCFASGPLLPIGSVAFSGFTTGEFTPTHAIDAPLHDRCPAGALPLSASARTRALRARAAPGAPLFGYASFALALAMTAVLGWHFFRRPQLRVRGQADLPARALTPP